MTYDGANTYTYDPENRLITATKCTGPLAAACDIEELTFTTGGDGQWFAQTTEYNYDGDAAQSGDIGDDEETWLETTVEGTGTVRFDRKVSSDGSDSLSFEVDGHYQAGWTAGGWDEYVHQITTGGTHTLRWTYMKDSSGSGGSDCAWVDHVRWSGDLPDPNGWQEIAYTYDPREGYASYSSSSSSAASWGACQPVRSFFSMAALIRLWDSSIQGKASSRPSWSSMVTAPHLRPVLPRSTSWRFPSGSPPVNRATRKALRRG